jgi:hypothetical protein
VAFRAIVCDANADAGMTAEAARARRRMETR